MFNLISYKSFQIHPLVKGDSPTSQAYAIRLAMVKCLLCLDDDIRLILKTNSYTSTDCRMVDRKEAGCCKAGNHTDLPNMERRDDKGYPNHLNDNHRANPWLLSEPGSDLNNIEAAIVVRISLGFNINNAASSWINSRFNVYYPVYLLTKSFQSTTVPPIIERTLYIKEMKELDINVSFCFKGLNKINLTLYTGNISSKWLLGWPATSVANGTSSFMLATGCQPMVLSMEGVG
ncbi:30S ribosomal subunit protein S9 [Candidatus Hodgkinia cicadicola]|uniref:Small ribosomal subunit protein uS9 n=1 Tax=Candidatus Hodgkinia cicadicola TaxID=573658 RepID=A0ABX4MHM8_9HYPH|nr:30S ribosomal subunit protein S9 [Candidatus Hodgkinia cicadicola]